MGGTRSKPSELYKLNGIESSSDEAKLIYWLRTQKPISTTETGTNTLKELYAYDANIPHLISTLLQIIELPLHTSIYQPRKAVLTMFSVEKETELSAEDQSNAVSILHKLIKYSMQTQYKEISYGVHYMSHDRYHIASELLRHNIQTLYNLSKDYALQTLDKHTDKASAHHVFDAYKSRYSGDIEAQRDFVTKALNSDILLDTIFDVIHAEQLSNFSPLHTEICSMVELLKVISHMPVSANKHKVKLFKVNTLYIEDKKEFYLHIEHAYKEIFTQTGLDNAEAISLYCQSLPESDTQYCIQAVEETLGCYQQALEVIAEDHNMLQSWEEWLYSWIYSTGEVT